jgi:hypothetical protein
MTTRHAAIEKQIATFQARIAGARAEAAQLALALVDAPGDQKFLDEIESVERVIQQHERSIARLQAAQAEAERRDSREARLERFELLRAQRKRLVDGNADVEQLAGEIQAALDALHPLLAKWDALVADRQSDAFAIARAAGKNDDTMTRFVQLDAGEVREAAARLVAASGIGTIGPRVDPYVHVSAPSKMSRWMSLADAVRLTNGRFVELLNERFEDAVARLGLDDATARRTDRKRATAVVVPAILATAPAAAPAPVENGAATVATTPTTLLTAGYIAQPTTANTATTEAAEPAARPPTGIAFCAGPEQKPRKKRRVAA